jgi:hypothetical protein
MADRNEGCILACAGCAITAIAVGAGAWGFLGALTTESYDAVWPKLLGAAVGVMFGVIVFIIGIVGMGEGGGDGAIHVSPNRCRRCGSRVRANPKTCKMCGVEKPLQH